MHGAAGCLAIHNMSVAISAGNAGDPSCVSASSTIPASGGEPCPLAARQRSNAASDSNRLHPGGSGTSTDGGAITMTSLFT